MILRRTVLVAGVDEAGRGPLAGPVVAAAVILDPRRRIRGLADSKVLSPERREALAILIREHALAWATGSADVGEIDTINILHATMLAMTRAVAALHLAPEEALIDGNRCPQLQCRVRAIVKGDRDVASISAASIIAKTTRDALLREFDRVYPVYGFAQHKGYGTPEHLAALERHGPCPLHRRTFAPVRMTGESKNLLSPGPSTDESETLLSSGQTGIKKSRAEPDDFF